MSILNLENIVKSYGEKTILDHISCAVEEGEHIGVVGINGAGKSTLLSVAAGIAGCDEGQVICRKNLRFSYLPQSPVFDSSLPVLDNVTSMIRGKHSHWDTAGEARSLLKRFGIGDPGVFPEQLSGGQRKLAALIAVLLTPSDLLILDEPTNHLDHETIEWLQEQLQNYSGALLMVTHDRYFLDEAADRIWELDRAKLYSYAENYSGYLELKQQRLDAARAAERKMAALYQQDLKWMLRGARARSTKQKAHIRRFEALRDREKIMEERNAVISSIPSRLGRTVLEIDHIAKAYGDRLLFSGFSYIFSGTDRIGIIGPNGCGKTTLLRILLGKEAADSGSVTVGQTVRFGYFSQQQEESGGNMRVIDCIREVAEFIQTPDGPVSASAMCERFLFDPQMQYTPVRLLSGGEKRRLYLLKVLMGAPNILVLDEPTNDLDIQTLQVLEDYLDTFSGVIIAVSHDRFFLDRVVTRIFSFERDGKLYRSEGAYTEYLEHRENSRSCVPTYPDPEDSVPDALPEPSKNARTGHSSRKLSFREQREYDSLEEQIDRLTEEVGQTDREMLSASSDFVKLSELSRRKEELENLLEEKITRYVELEDKLSALRGE